jgi:hypothetical protein
MRVSRFVMLAAVLSIVTTAAPATTARALPAASGAATRPHELFGVSCVSPANCVAVGSIDNGKAGNGASPLAETWHGRSWQTSTVKLPAGAFDTALSGVSCTPAGECFAVGAYDTLRTDVAPLVETWNGTAWTPSTPPTPAGSSLPTLDGVSCATAKSCVAIGGYLKKTGGFVPLAERWNGMEWIPATPPAVRGSVDSELTTVSCVSAARCVAAGSYQAGNGGSAVLIESWNGTAWKRMPAPAPAGGTDPFLTGVSCASASSCVAVGVAGSNVGLTAFSEVWNGTTWRVARVAWPRGTGNSYLAGVWCAKPTRCLAAGHTGFNASTGENTGRAAAVFWNGKAWRVTGVPAPVKGEASLFNAVSCLSAADCVAAGQEGPFNTIQGNGLTGFWNGKGWKLVAAA